MIVSERLSRTAYAVVDEKSGKRYLRTVTNIQPYRASNKAPTNNDAVSSTYEIGDMIATRDNDASDEVWIGEVTSVDAESVKCHYWCTSSRNAVMGVFKPAYIGNQTGQTILTYTLGNVEKCEPWSGVLPRDLIVSKVRLSTGKRGLRKLTAASRRDLLSFRVANL